MKKGLISEEKLEMLENRYSNFEDLSSNSKEKVVKEEVKEKDREVKIEEMDM